MTNMATIFSVDWAERIATVDDMYCRKAFAECIEAVRDLLREPLLPSLYAIKCHVILGKASVDMTDKKRHKDTAEQLWTLSESYWPEKFRWTTAICEIQQDLDLLAKDITRTNLPRLEESAVHHKRQRSQSSSPRAYRRMRVGPDSPWSTEENDPNHVWGAQEKPCGKHTVRQSIEYDDFVLYDSSRSFTPVVEDQDVKFDPRDLDKEHERANQSQTVTDGPHPTPLAWLAISPIPYRPSTPPCTLDSPPSYKVESPAQYTSARPSAPGAPFAECLSSPIWSGTQSPLFKY
jgi:hypothetical protein